MQKLGFFRCIGRAIKGCFNFKGRACRKEFYSYIIFSFIMVFPICLWTLNFTEVELFDVICFDIVLFPIVALSVRRMHDTGLPGWWAILGLIPYVGMPGLLIYSIRDSEPGTNNWGPNPKGVVERDDDF